MTRHHAYALVQYTNLVVHKNWYIKYLVLLTYLKQPLVFVRCTIPR